LNERARLCAVVRGVVQGVGFRWSVWRRAEMLGLVGYAKNRADGAVEVVAEGPAADLDDLERYLRSGPGAATVTDLDASRGQATGEFSRFAVK
jgi:acylphosphatase